MDPPNNTNPPAAERKPYQNEQEYWTRQIQKILDYNEKATRPSRKLPADVPITQQDKLARVRQLVAAMKNMDNIVDNSEDNYQVAFVKDCSDEELTEMAWHILVSPNRSQSM